MKEYAVVKSVQDGTATVSVKRETSCGDSCANCPSKCERMNNEVVVKNPLNAKAGDKVVIEMSTKNVLTSAFLVYILPLIFLIFGYAIIRYIGFAEVICILSGLVLFAITFVALHFWDIKNKDKFTTTIVEILGE